MKIPSSSSLIFTALAISSSSSSLGLAAPTGDAQGDGIPSSSSNNFIASRRGSFNIPRSESEYFVREQEERVAAAEIEHATRGMDFDDGVHESSMDKRGLLNALLPGQEKLFCGLLGGLIPKLPALGPALISCPEKGKAASTASFDAESLESNPSFESADQMAAEQVDGVTSTLSDGSSDADDGSGYRQDSDEAVVEAVVIPQAPPNTPSPDAMKNIPADAAPVPPSSVVDGAAPVQPSTVTGSAPVQDGKDGAGVADNMAPVQQPAAVVGPAPTRRHWSRHMLRGRVVMFTEPGATQPSATPASKGTYNVPSKKSLRPKPAPSKPGMSASAQEAEDDSGDENNGSSDDDDTEPDDEEATPDEPSDE